MDLPTYIEASYICTTAVKLMWVCCYILVYGLRPVMIRPKKIGERPCRTTGFLTRCPRRVKRLPSALSTAQPAISSCPFSGDVRRADWPAGAPFTPWAAARHPKDPLNLVFGTFSVGL